MQIEKIFSESILQKLFENRHEEFSHKFTTLTDTKKIYDNLENRLKSLLGYINNEHYNYAELEIDGILSDMQVCIEYWNSSFYKLGVIDGMKLKKELQKKLEENIYGNING